MDACQWAQHARRPEKLPPAHCKNINFQLTNPQIYCGGGGGGPSPPPCLRSCIFAFISACIASYLVFCSSVRMPRILSCDDLWISIIFDRMSACDSEVSSWTAFAWVIASALIAFT